MHGHLTKVGLQLLCLLRHRSSSSTIGVEVSFNAPDKFGISRIGIQFRVFTEIPTSWPDRLHVTTLAFEMAWPGLNG
jgi:hypothetical protein